MRKAESTIKRLETRKCPFCGGNGIPRRSITLPNPYRFFVECEECGARGRVANGCESENPELTMNKAIKFWNMRPEED